MNPRTFAAPRLVGVALPILAAWTLAVSLPGAAWAWQGEAAVPARQTLAFIGVNVVPMDTERVLADQTVVVRDGRIAAVGPSGEVRVPDDAVRIDARGKFLMPGLAEMHGHLPGGNAPQDLVQNVLFLYVANGITLVRGMQGHPSQLALRDAIARGELLGPRLILAGPSLGGNLETETAARRVREQKDAGFDLLKIHEGLSPEVYGVIVATAREVGIPFAGHVPDAVGLFGALDAGQATVDHLDNYVEALIPASELEGAPALFGVAERAGRADASRIPELAAATVRAGAAVVPTMALWEVFFGGRSGASLRSEMPELRYLPPQAAEGWERAVDQRNASMGDPAGGRRVVELRRQILRALNEAGATILLGTDSPQLFSVPGFSIHREMALMVEAGMTPYQVLRSGTRAIAEHFGELESAGTVEPGRRADLILLDANPLEDVRNVARQAGVVVDGRWLPGAEIRRRLSTIANAYAAQ